MNLNKITLSDKRQYIAVEDNDLDYLDCSQCAFRNNAMMCNEATKLIDCSDHGGLHFELVQEYDLRPDTTQMKEFVYATDTSATQAVGTKYDEDKLQYSLIPSYALEQVAKNLTVGLKKYKERDNWKKVQGAEQRYLDALYRHLEAHRRGELYDADSSAPNMPHLAAVAVNAMFLLEFMLDPALKKKENK